MQEQHEAATSPDSALERWIVEPGQARTITVEDVASLRVGVIGGHVDVVGHDEPTARIEVLNVEGRPLEVTLEHGKLTVAHPLVRWGKILDSLQMLVGEKASVEVSISVPRGVALTYGQVSAEGLVSGLRNGAHVSSVSGALQLDDVQGAIDCNTVSGDVAATNVNGAVQVHAVNGEVALAGTMPTVGVDTVNGTVLLDVEGPVGVIAVNSVSAEVTVRVDHDRTIDASMRTISGSANVAGIALPKRGGEYVSAAPGVDAGTVRVTLNSVSGDLSIVRRA